MHLPSAGNQPVQFIDQPHLLQRSLEQMAQSDILSFDLEFDNNRYSYGVTLCLVQVATPAVCYVIDPLAGLELDGLYALFASEKIQKILHAPGEDLRLLHSLGCYPKNLFDTEVVARLLNYEQTSLTVLLRDKLQFDMDKKHQKSNWLTRPLSAGQVQYAADDVVWLHRLKGLLEAEAAEKGLLPFVQEEQALLSTTIHRSVPKTNFLKPADLVALSPREQYITNELLRYRDGLARDANKPAYQVMSEELVRSLASGMLSPEGIAQETGVHPRFRNHRFGTQLAKQLRQIREAAAAQNLATEPQGRPRLNPDQHAAIRKAADDREHLFAPIQQVLAGRYGTYAAQFMLSNRIVNDIVRNPAFFTSLPVYRQKLFGEIAAELGLSLDDYRS